MGKPSYRKNDAKGWCGDPRRGAAMGRPHIQGDPDYSGKLTLQHVRIGWDGYDSNGTYFGLGAPLYWYASEDGTIDSIVRVKDREAAKAAIRLLYPSARFYR